MRVYTVLNMSSNFGPSSGLAGFPRAAFPPLSIDRNGPPPNTLSQGASNSHQLTAACDGQIQLLNTALQNEAKSHNTTRESLYKEFQYRLVAERKSSEMRIQLEQSNAVLREVEEKAIRLNIKKDTLSKAK